MDNTQYDTAIFDDIALDYRTPRLDSCSASPDDQSQQRSGGPGLPLLQLSDWDKDLPYDESPPTCIHYSIEWKLLLNKGGRLTKLTYNPEREQDLVLAPGAFWNRTLKQVVEERLEQKTPRNKCYEPEETSIVVSVSDRAERNLSKRFGEFNIDWEVSSVSRGKKLQIDIAFICKAAGKSAAVQTRQSTRRGATGRQHAELAAEQEEDEAAGRINHWSKVYAIMRCTGPPCTGTQCWRDPDQKRHFRADGEVMQKLVAYSEDGHKFDDQRDMPAHIRDLIYDKDAKDAERKETAASKKRKRASGDCPIQITNILPGPSNQASSEQSALCPGGHNVVSPSSCKIDLCIPEPRDDAIRRYCVWHCARVSNETWKACFRKLAAITLGLGLDLKHIHADQNVELFIKDAKAGIMPGIARSWVEDVKIWVEKLKDNDVQ
ncbi:hypothetical protein PT974_12198 [Cladobotryum mycophilum]|uniref:Uncharacterized protein n=1 Tax=Cladobotryum mycophilum TaxID=491253 RepID=A0ABR0S7C6_9HYPO